MPINEANRKTRDRWPLAFDLEGVPRESAERERLLLEQKALENLGDISPEEPLAMQGTRPIQNHFAVDTPTETVVDVNNPPQKRYRHQQFPQMVYHHQSGHVLIVQNAVELQAAQKRGFQEKPALDRDYSQVRAGHAAPMKQVAPREVALSASDLAEVETEVETSDEVEVASDVSEVAQDDSTEESRPRRGRR
jgi:hypothetical protein